MPIGIDHIVIAVNDLDTTTRDYTKLGFTVVPGGKHTNGLSSNVLIAFADGTYFELIAFHDLTHPDNSPWAYALQESGEGLVDYALRTNDLDAEVETLCANGLRVIGPTPGGRNRPDGKRVDWRTIRFEEAGLPFYCHDETPRPLRVPGGPEAEHANGIFAVQRITIPVPDVDAARTLYQRLTGVDGETVGNAVRFGIGQQAIDLVEGEGAQPLEVTLAGPEITLDPALTHGARLTVA